MAGRRKTFYLPHQRVYDKDRDQKNDVQPGGIVFYDAVVQLGTQYINRTGKDVRVVGYRVVNVDYCIATDHHDLYAEQIAFAYKLRWNTEIFFGWWKRHLKVYHLISKSKYGLMVQMLAGLITYIPLAIYCYNEYEDLFQSNDSGKSVSKSVIKRASLILSTIQASGYITPLAQEILMQFLNRTLLTIS